MKLRDILIASVIILVVLSTNIVGLFTNYLWFNEVGYPDVFFTILITRAVLGTAAFALFFVFLYINIKAALKNTSTLTNELPLIYSGLILILSLIFGFIASSKWDIVLRYLNSVPFNLSDPVFGHDISFYVFSIPFYNFLLSSLFAMTLISGLGAAIIYLINGGILRQLEDWEDMRYRNSNVINILRIPENTKIHFAVISGLLSFLIAIKFYLLRFDILYISKKAFYGPGYADINIQLNVITIMIAIALIVSLLFFLSVKKVNIKWPVIGIILLIILFTAGSFLTVFVQQYRVLPDE